MQIRRRIELLKHVGMDRADHGMSGSMNEYVQ
jgi:hypothetical protein